MLLENIKILDYKNVDGFIGFDTDETLAVIKVLFFIQIIFILFLNDYVNILVIFSQSMAKFHSLCIGMRRQQPELFNSKVSPFVDAVNMIIDGDDTRMVDVNETFDSQTINTNSIDLSVSFLIKNRLFAMNCDSLMISIRNYASKLKNN